jgi:hypothetical protein
VGVLQVGRRPDLGEEPLGTDDRCELGAEHFDGHRPPVPEVAGKVHRRHPAPPELTLDAVAVAQSFNEAGWRCRHLVPNEEIGRI